MKKTTMKNGLSNRTLGTADRGAHRIERALVLIASLGTLLVAFLYVDLFQQWFRADAMDKSQLYGRWVEQEVAPYAQEVFYLSERGVTRGGAVLATTFEFDERYLQYQIGDEIIRYQFLNDELDEMKRQSKQRYNPVFRLIR